ncbi:MAG: hypothetical protein LBM02_03975 [Lachnospiraceae bacterium]|jgi:hypothetical protein|nr:hypothetical protein [Lachnospiraceae bacterium]
MNINAGDFVVYKKINSRYTVIKVKNDFYLLDYGNPYNIRTYVSIKIFDKKIDGYKIPNDQLIRLVLKEENNNYYKSGLVPLIALGIIRVGLPPFYWEPSLFERGMMILILLFIYLLREIYLGILKPPINIGGLQKVVIQFSPEFKRKQKKNKIGLSVLIFVCAILDLYFILFVEEIPMIMVFILSFLLILTLQAANWGNFNPRASFIIEKSKEEFKKATW